MLQPILFGMHPPEDNDFLFAPPIIRDFIANALIIFFFYINFYKWLPTYYFQKKYYIYFACLVASLLVITFVPSLLTGRSLMMHGPMHGPHNDFIVGPPHHAPHHDKSTIAEVLHEVNHHLFLFLTVVFFSLLLRVREKLHDTENARHNAEMSYLLSQISPHFLFNILNSIYIIAVKEKAKQSSDSIMQLSNMLRYIVTESKQHLVGLDDEIQCLKNYIALQQLRLSENVKLQFVCNGNFAAQQIAPLLLMPFVENAFKHGVNPEEDSVINIQISVVDNSLYFDVSNHKVTANSIHADSSGIGIQNTKDRLQLMYANKHQLCITDTATDYQVHLTIQLK